MTDHRAPRLLAPATISRRLHALRKQLLADLGIDHPDPETVHRIRVQIKQSRAWIRLQRGAGKKRWRKLDRALARTAKRLAGSRDMHVARETLAWLAEQSPDPTLAEHCRTLSGALTDMAPSPPAAAGLSRRHRDRLEKLLGDSPTPAEIRAGLQATHARACKLAENAGGSAARLHRLRRWVKHLYHQCDLSCPKTAPEPRLLKKLGHRLGRVQDLSVLEDTLRSLEHSTGHAEAAQEIRRFAKRQRHLLQDSLEPAIDALQEPGY